MKRAIIFFALELFSRALMAQTGLQFAPNYSHYSQIASFLYTPGIGQPPVCVCNYQQTKINGDTIIGNKYMQKLDTSNFHAYDSICLNFWTFIYYDSSRVYIGTNPNSMFLIYDFNLLVGDSFTFNAVLGTPNPNTYVLAVDSVDTINLGGVMRKRIRFTRIPFSQNTQDPIQWVEGIGDYTHGWVLDYGFIVYANYVDNGICSLSCFTDNSTTTFGNCLYSSCIIGTNEISHNSFEIYPNPASYKLIIASESNSTTIKIQLINIHGQTTLAEKYEDIYNTIELDISKIHSGMYFLSIIQGEKTKVYKIIIQH